MARRKTVTAATGILVCLFALSILAQAELPPNFECPTSVDVTFPTSRYVGYGEEEYVHPYTSLHDLHSAMSKCPDIADLKLRISLLGCSEWPDRWNLPFDQAGTDSFASRPTQISLEGYDFTEQQWMSDGPPSWRSLLPGVGGFWEWDRAITWLFGDQGADWFHMRNLPAQQREKNNLELWIDAMDFSAVTNLTLHDDHTCRQADALVRILPDQLPALRTLNIKGPWAYDFIRALPKNSLSHLTWKSSRLLRVNNTQNDLDTQLDLWKENLCAAATNGQKSLYDVWDHIGGPQLESLEFRNEDGVDGSSWDILSVDHLRALSAAIPNLRNLTLDLKRSNNSWPEAELGSIAREFPALEVLNLYLELASECRQQNMWDMHKYNNLRTKANGSLEDNCLGDAQFMKPLVNESNASQLFDFLQQLNVEEGAGKLRELNLFAGDWSRPWDGPIYMPSWIEGRQAWASCSVGHFGQGRMPGVGSISLCKAEDRSGGHSWYGGYD